MKYRKINYKKASVPRFFSTVFFDYAITTNQGNNAYYSYKHHDGKI